jgi:hypothetical protein
MNDTGKLPQSVIGAVSAWVLVVLQWITAHGFTVLTALCGAAAFSASIYSAMASRATRRAADASKQASAASELASQETIKLRKKQQERLTSKPVQEPDNDL